MKTESLLAGILVAALLGACTDREAAQDPTDAARAATEAVDQCTLLTNAEIESATGIAPTGSAPERLGCGWTFDREILGQATPMPLVNVSAVMQATRPPATWEKFLEDFEASFGGPWEGMTRLEGLGLYAWTDGTVLQVQKENGFLVSLVIARQAEHSEQAYRALASHILDRL